MFVLACAPVAGQAAEIQTVDGWSMIIEPAGSSVDPGIVLLPTSASNAAIEGMTIRPAVFVQESNPQDDSSIAPPPPPLPSVVETDAAGISIPANAPDEAAAAAAEAQTPVSETITPETVVAEPTATESVVAAPPRPRVERVPTPEPGSAPETAPEPEPDANTATTSRTVAEPTAHPIVSHKTYQEVYDSIPFSRSEYDANPAYRHEATMEILLGQLRPKIVHQHAVTSEVTPVRVITPFRYTRGRRSRSYNFYYPIPSGYHGY